MAVHLGAVRVGVAGCAASFFVSTLACSQPLSGALEVVGTGACPPAEAVRAAIFQLTSAERRRALPPNSRVTVSDEGQTYRVTVSGEGTAAQKSYTDPARDCARRTRFAAVFAILTLMPPELEEDEAAVSTEPAPTAASEPAPTGGSERPSAPSNPPPTDTSSGRGSSSKTEAEETSANDDESERGSRSAGRGPRERPLVRLELVALGETALGALEEPRGQSLGGELRAAFSRSSFAPLLTFGFAPPSRLEAGRVDVDVQRLQFGLGVRALSPLGPFTVGADLSLLGALERVAGVGLQHPARSNAFELGARGAVLISLASGRVGPLLALHASAIPAPSEFEALPRGDVGRMPHVWLGAALGAYLGL